MSNEIWSEVDSYIASTLFPSDPVLEHALRSAEEGQLPSINVTPNQGKLLYLLARMSRAKKILEIGTLGAYSTLWLARALPSDGKIITLEYDPAHAAVAAKNIEYAGFADKAEVRLGAALDTLPALEAEGCGPFDFIFIDADKINNARYLGWALKLSHPGTVIICDNVIRDGRIIDKDVETPDVVGTREFFQALAAEPRLSGTAVQTVGSKGYDGFALAIVSE